MIGNDANSYANWLGTKIGGGDAFVGKKAYHSGNNSTDLSSAFTEVLDMIKESAFRAMYEPELTADPMGEHIEFLGFYNKSGKFVDVKKQSTLTGSHTENGENSVSYASQINWDLLNSGYTLTKTGSGLSRYVYTLKYRVRLENELDDFIENQFYDTNGTTTLTYKTPEGKEKTLEYPKPQVEGYLTHLQFTKQDDAGKALAGAEFSLTHNKNCPVCGGAVTIPVFTSSSDSNGKVVIGQVMVSGQPVDILPSGHTYTLTETKSPTGYKNPTATYEVRIAYGVNYINGSTDPLTVKNTPLTPATVQLSGTKTVDGKATVTHEQEEHINSDTTIINHPVAQVDLFGTKRMIGRPLQGDDYAFVLEEVIADPSGTTTTKKIDDASCGSDGLFAFDPLVFDYQDEGIHTYNIREIIPAEANAENGYQYQGVTYDPSVYTVIVTVDVEEDHQVNVSTAYMKNDTAVPGVVFNNVYTIKGSTKVTFSGTKTMADTSDRGLRDKEYVFDLYNADEDFNPVGNPVETVFNAENGAFSFTLTEVPTSGNPTTIETVTNDADGKFAFAPLKYTKNDLGTHEYTIKETSGSAGGVNYDTSIYSITIEVVDDGFGGLVAASTVEKDGHPSSDLLFQNEYTVTGQVEVPLTGTKTLSNATLKEGQFHFQLFAANENFQADGEALETVANNAAGHIAFTNLTFDPTDIGTHYYVIREKDEGKAGFTYDSGEYHVTITIGHDGEGNTTQDTVIRKAGSTSSVTSFAFSNAYEDPADTVLKLDVTKRIQSTSRRRTIAPEGFRFRLVNADNAAEAYTAVSDKDGKATFSLSYTHEDLGKTFTYTLTEDKGDIKNVTYSTDSYTIKVSIWLDETTNTLKATILRDGTEIPENTPVAEFVNRYRPPFSVIPDTGDSSHIFLWFTALATSAALLLCLLLWRRRKA